MAELIPFDLERAKRGDEIITRDGRKARYIGSRSKTHSRYTVIAEVYDIEEDEWSYNSFAEDGAINKKVPSEIDLFMKYPEEEGTVTPTLARFHEDYPNVDVEFDRADNTVTITLRINDYTETEIDNGKDNQIRR